METEKTITININGGYGRVIASTGVIKKLALDTGRTINIVTGYPEIFMNNPYINKVYNLHHEYLYDDHIKGTEYKEPEPYKLQGYIDGELHMINGFSKELLAEDIYLKPDLHFTDEELKEAEVFVKQMEKPLILFQPWGSSGGKSKDGKTMVEDQSFRSIPLEFAKKVYDELSKDYTVVLVKSPDQLGWKEALTLPHMPLRKIFALIPYAKGIVACDSALQHACAALDKGAFVFWGSTNSNQLGYELHRNIEGETTKNQFNPVRVPGNDMDAQKRYVNTWNYLNDELIKEIKNELAN